MIFMDINKLKDLGSEIMYNDSLTGEVVTGIVARVDKEDENTAFAYIVSPYNDENDKIEGNLRYKEIIVFDNRPSTEHGWHRNPIQAMAKNPINR